MGWGLSTSQCMFTLIGVRSGPFADGTVYFMCMLMLSSLWFEPWHAIASAYAFTVRPVSLFGNKWEWIEDGIWIG